MTHKLFYSRPKTITPLYTDINEYDWNATPSLPDIIDKHALNRIYLSEPFQIQRLVRLIIKFLSMHTQLFLD